MGVWGFGSRHACADSTAALSERSQSRRSTKHRRQPWLNPAPASTLSASSKNAVRGSTLHRLPFKNALLSMSGSYIRTSSGTSSPGLSRTKSKIDCMCVVGLAGATISAITEFAVANFLCFFVNAVAFL